MAAPEIGRPKPPSTASAGVVNEAKVANTNPLNRISLLIAV